MKLFAEDARMGITQTQLMLAAGLLFVVEDHSLASSTAHLDMFSTELLALVKNLGLVNLQNPQPLPIHMQVIRDVADCQMVTIPCQQIVVASLFVPMEKFLRRNYVPMAKDSTVLRKNVFHQTKCRV